MEDLVSIIIPVYNAEKYLETCLNSVINQTYKNLEILLINDGSTDNSEEICEKFKKTDSRIKLYYTINSGPGFARNLGLSRAIGDYIMFVDSDDSVDTKIVEILMEELKKNDGDVSASYVLPSHEQIYYEKMNEGICDKKTFIQYLLSDNIKSYLMGKIYKKKLWENVRFPIDMKVEDVAVLYKVFFAANTIVNVPKHLYFYTEDNPNSETRTQTKIEGLYPRFYFGTERYAFARKYYPEVADTILYQTVSYGNMSYFKMIGIPKYKEEMEKILKYFRENNRAIFQNKSLPWYKKLETWCIIHNWKIMCLILDIMHEKKPSR